MARVASVISGPIPSPGMSVQVVAMCASGNNEVGKPAREGCADLRSVLGRVGSADVADEDETRTADIEYGHAYHGTPGPRRLSRLDPHLDSHPIITSATTPRA